ncbi:MAG: hypothetical protein JW716_00505 [Candidatus Aenigmarchaeota archaeon]|nr:hypothetical protein [Candidatus Aenigmarchaeota archaeon]
MEILDLFALILLITVVAAVVTASQIDYVSIKTIQTSSTQKMLIVDYSKTVESCLLQLCDGKFIDAEKLDEIRDESDDIDEICDMDLLKGMYVRLEAVNSDRIWEFGKSKGDKKKGSHMSWINIGFKEIEKIQKEGDFQIESGDYEITIRKIDNGLLEKDSILLSFKKLSTNEALQEFNVQEKEQINGLYEEALKNDEDFKKSFILRVPEGEIYNTDNFLVEGYTFRKFGDSYTVGRGRPLWFDVEGDSLTDVGTLYVEI